MGNSNVPGFLFPVWLSSGANNSLFSIHGRDIRNRAHSGLAFTGHRRSSFLRGSLEILSFVFSTFFLSLKNPVSNSVLSPTERLMYTGGHVQDRQSTQTRFKQHLSERQILVFRNCSNGQSCGERCMGQGTHNPGESENVPRRWHTRVVLRDEESTVRRQWRVFRQRSECARRWQEEHESGAWGGGCAREQRMTVLPEVREVDLSEDVEKRWLISLSDLSFVLIGSSNHAMFPQVTGRSIFIEAKRVLD